MVGASSVGGRRLASAVLALLVTLSVLHIPRAGVGEPGPKLRAGLVTSCVDCCGSNCQCAGDCCGDSHIETTVPSTFEWTTAERVSKDRNCEKGSWLSPTVKRSFQRWFVAPRQYRHTTAQALFLTSIEFVLRWQHPAISQANPRGPPPPVPYPSSF